MQPGNILSHLEPADDGGERFEPLVDCDGLLLERIVSHGHATPAGEWYDQERDEWVVVVQGRARLRFEAPDETVPLEAGQFLLIPAHRRHRVEWTDPRTPTIWLALHFDGCRNAPGA